MIFTSCYKNCRGGNTVSMSYDGGISENYEGKTLESLGTMQLKESNPSNENVVKYVKEYYEKVLSKQDIRKVFRELNNSTGMTIGNVYREGTILLDYEEPLSFSNRFIIVCWLELYYGIDIPEIIIEKDLKFKRVKKNKFYPIIKGTLETLMKRDMEMYDFNCILAAVTYARSFTAPEHFSPKEPWNFNKKHFIDEARRIEQDYNEKRKDKNI